ncbi:MAG: hypothetical protein J0G36_20215 [Afipia sp.]|nr:hypothetical protein [Afipia sp.]
MAGTSPAMTFGYNCGDKETTDSPIFGSYISLPGEWIELDIRDLATADM